MGFSRKYIEDRSFVLTMVRDGANNENLEDHVRTMGEEIKDLHPVVELADTTQLHDLSGFTKTGVVVAGSIEFDRTPAKTDRLAILVASDEVYELAEKYQAISSNFRSEARIFWDFDQAIEWLGVSDLGDQINQLRQQ